MTDITHKLLERHPLGNPHRVWRQDNYILSTFSCRGDNMRRAVRTCRDAGFNLIELGWAEHEQALEAVSLCEEYRLDLLYQDFSEFGGMQKWHLDRISSADDPEAALKAHNQLLKALADKLRPYRHTIGYYVWDEPLLHEQLLEARRQADILQAHTPEKLPFTVAIPSYNTDYTWQNGKFTDYLTDYVETIDPPVLSLDYYPYGLPGYNDDEQLDNSLFWCDLGLMRVLCKKYSLPLWFYYQAVNLYKYAHFEFEMVRCQMYAAALYGAKGLQSYTAVGSVITESGEPDVFFNETKQIHSEFDALGNTLMALDSYAVYHSPELLSGSQYIDGLADDIADSDILTGPLDFRISVGELRDEYGNRYFMVLNRDFTVEKSTSIKLKRPMRRYDVSRADGSQSHIGEVDTIDLTLAPGDAALIRLQETNDEPFTCEYRISC